MEAIRVEDLHYSYDGKTKAVDGLSFSVKRGEIFGFLGPSGAGKSTTIKLMTRLIVPPGNTVYVLGQDMNRANTRFFKKIGISFENDVLYPTLTGWENLEFHARLYGIGREKVREMLKTVDLDHAMDRRVSEYSRGMKTRLVLARALVTDPEILFLDEPTSGMDPDIAASIRKVILSGKEKGTTVFLTTHDMHEAEQLCDRIAFFHNGKIVETDSPESFKKRYGKNEIVVEFDHGKRILDRDRDLSALADIVAENKWTRIHSREATLEEIFIRVVGRGLKGT